MSRSIQIILSLVTFGSAAFFLVAHAEDRPPEPLALGLADNLEKATFAGGCFWCMEPPFDQLDGVISTTSGYAGGDEPNPTYESISGGKTGHAEVVQVVFDPSRVSYEKLLHVYWRNVDPLTSNRQFCDRGRQYRTAILAHDDAQIAAAEASKSALEAAGRFDRAIVTEIVKIGQFTPAEGYHQDYYQKNPIRYAYYRRGCGRDARLEALWGEAASGEENGSHR
jgi:peptide-methionine (S)-S-oxide reductase